jgi:hypothetical protein
MQTTSTLLAKHLKEVYFGGNWTWSNLKTSLEDVNWIQATTKVHGLNTMVALTYHINYFVIAITEVLQGKELTAKDKYSFDHPSITNEEDWQQFKIKVFQDGETLIRLIENFEDEKLSEIFIEEKYGTYFRNFLGVNEHFHYHLGQINILKKLIA